MSKQAKALARITASPTPADIRWTELVTALESVGYQLLKNKGSRRKFVHSESKDLISIHEPHPSPEVPKYAVETVVEHLKSQGLI